MKATCFCRGLPSMRTVSTKIALTRVIGGLRRCQSATLPPDEHGRSVPAAFDVTTTDASLERDYKSASDLGIMVIFVRDNMERKLVSYIMSIDTITVQ